MPEIAISIDELNEVGLVRKVRIMDVDLFRFISLNEIVYG